MSRKKSIGNKKICERIKSLRLDLSLSGVDFSNNVGISQGYLSDVENGKALPNKTLLLALSYSYNINYEWLLTGKGKMTRKTEQKICCTAESSPIYNKEGNNDKDPETADLLTRAVKILKSKTEYSDSLAANIKSFHRAIQTEERLGSIDEEIKKIKKSLKQSDNIRKADQENHRGEILKKRKM